jgi:diketogulonate reductase-like aldo/keto reductase
MVIAFRAAPIPGSTALGFGCSQLMGGITRRDSIALLEVAFDVGIRHFDVAPSYGYGQAESVLGETFRLKRDRITIATKFGIQPPRSQSLLGIGRRLLIPVVGRIPAIKSRLSRIAGALKERARFSPHELSMSLEKSLRALRTDHIDVLLLHEAVVADLSDELFALLERSVREGKIVTFGIGSERTSVEQIYHLQRRFCPVLQFEWSVLSRELPTHPGSVVITHRSLSESFGRLKAWLRDNPAVARVWTDELAMDVADSSVLSRLMISASLHANQGGIVLFSSRNTQNIKANAKLMANNDDLLASSIFSTLVARDAAELRGA